MQYFLILIWLRKLDVMLMQSNRDVSTAPLACPLARSLAPLSRLLPLHCSLRSRTPLRSFVLALAHSLAPQLMGKWFMSMK